MDIEQVIRSYIPQVLHMSLATVENNIPWVSEVHFAYDEDLNLYFRSLPSRRHSQEIIHNPRVAGAIVKQHTLDDPVVGVYFDGTAQQLLPGDGQQMAFACIKTRLRTTDDILAEASRPDGHQFYKISVDNYYIFGKFGGGAAQKYTLTWNKRER